MSIQKGSIVVADGNGTVVGITPGPNNSVLIADSTQTYGVRNANIFDSNSLYVDKAGSDSVGQRNALPFLTISAALAAASSGDTVYINPGTYNEVISIPTGVTVTGKSMIGTIINFAASSTADLVTLSTNCLLENVTMNLTATTHIQLRGIVFSSTAATNSIVRDCMLTVDNSSAGVGTSLVVGVYSAGTGVSSNYCHNLDNVTVNVLSASSGIKRALYLLTNANTLNARNSKFRSSGGTDSIGAETNIASSVLTMRFCYCEGGTADISQTLGTINVNSTLLQNSNANSKSFNTVDVFPNTMQWCLSGAVTAGATRYMRISDASAANEIKQTVYRAGIVKNIYVRARTGPGGVIVDTYTFRKNGVDTSLVVNITGSAVSATLTNISVAFAAGDDISLKLVTGVASGQSDIVVTAEIY